MSEKRKFKRYLIGGHEALLITENTHELYHVKARDISERGVCLISNRPLPECQNCKVSVSLGKEAFNKSKGEYVEFIAQAVYHAEASGEYRYGLKMIAIDPKYQEVLAHYIAWREASEPK